MTGSNMCWLEAPYNKVAAVKEQARALGVEQKVWCVGQRPVADMPVFIQLADILVSPRKD
jgi:hypothetical protein